MNGKDETFLQKACKSPIKTGLIGIGTLTAFGLGVWYKDQIVYWMSQAACAVAGYRCEADEGEADEGVDRFDLIFSTQVPHCQIGRLERKFEGWDVQIALENGAERMVICADVAIRGTRDTQAQTLRNFGDRLDGCVDLVEREGGFRISPDIGSPSVCRARYRFNDLDLRPAPTKQGLLVCMDGHTHEDEQPPDGGPRICDETALENFGFL